jgi:hypothetical protein
VKIFGHFDPCVSLIHVFQENNVGYASNISSTDLEQAYIANPDGQLQFNTLGHKYILDFSRMVQRNIDYKTEREVARRPPFVSIEDFKQKKMQYVKFSNFKYHIDTKSFV